MHTIIDSVSTNRRTKALARPSRTVYRQPAYDCEDQGNAIRLVVYVPGVAASGVEIEGRGPDLTVTARKERFVRVNFDALHLEPAQRDYRLKLRLGNGVDFAAMEAEIANGVLTITLPKRSAGVDTARWAVER